MKASEKILGIVYAYNPGDDLARVHELGFEWIRINVPFPWTDKMHGTLDQEYIDVKAEFAKAVAVGLKVMPSTPGMGGYIFDEAEQRMFWHDSYPAFAGKPGTPEFYANVADTLEFICRDLGDLAGQYWQLMNEIDIEVFRGDYPMTVAADTCRASAEGVMRANPDARCGTNLAGLNDNALAMADLIFRPGHKFAYVGDDQYFGSWQPGTVEDWFHVIEVLHSRYGLPVLANEWGYSSAGRYATERPRPEEMTKGLPDVCTAKAWFEQIEGGHTGETEAAYLRRGLQIFAEHPDVIGSFVFCWKDALHCYHCGADDCPSECYWGIVDVNGEPKPAYYACRDAIKEYYGK